MKKAPRKYLMLRLWQYLSRYKIILLAGSLCMLLSNFLSLSGPKLSGKAIDAIGTKEGSVDFDKVFY